MKSCLGYDAGHDEEAIRIAQILRILLHDGGSNSASLLTQIGVRANLRYYGTPHTFETPDLFPLCTLSGRSTIGMSNPPHPNWAGYTPIYDYTSDVQTRSAFEFDVVPKRRWQTLSFDKWWESEVLHTLKGGTQTRAQLVKLVANKEGGAHVDLKLNQLQD